MLRRLPLRSIIAAPLAPFRAFLSRPAFPIQATPSILKPVSYSLLPSTLGRILGSPQWGVPMRHFSLKMRKVRAKQQSKRKVKKYKLKTHTGFAKRHWVTGTRNERVFKFKAAGARHLMRNKSTANKARKRRMKTITTPKDIRRARRLMPYFKRKKILI